MSYGVTFLRAHTLIHRLPWELTDQYFFTCTKSYQICQYSLCTFQAPRSHAGLSCTKSRRLKHLLFFPRRPLKCLSHPLSSWDASTATCSCLPTHAAKTLQLIQNCQLVFSLPELTHTNPLVISGFLLKTASPLKILSCLQNQNGPATTFDGSD